MTFISSALLQDVRPPNPCLLLHELLWITDTLDETSLSLKLDSNPFAMIQRWVWLLLKDSFYFYNRPLSPNTSQRAPSSHRCATLNQNTLASISKLLWLHLWKNGQAVCRLQFIVLWVFSDATNLIARNYYNLSTVSGDSDYNVELVSSSVLD